ncbi:MAG: garR [Subtercola sp.]|nr:garR [Subtercola sp.]
MRVAVLGTGTMGAGMARSLLRAGLDVTVWNRHAAKAQALAADGATVADSPAAAATGADVLLTMLFDEAAVAEVAAPALAALPNGSIWMQSATVGPAGAHRLAAIADADAVTFVDAPVVGTKKPADEGTLVALVSGPPDAVERLQPVLAAIGSKTINAGSAVGQASGLKLACNAWVASLTAATAQSLALSRALGVDPRLFLASIEGGASDSPYAQLKGGMMLGNDFTPSFAVDGLVKDLGLMQQAAAATGMPGHLLDALQQAFTVAADSGHADDDIAAVATSFMPLFTEGG